LGAYIDMLEQVMNNLNDSQITVGEAELHVNYDPRDAMKALCKRIQALKVGQWSLKGDSILLSQWGRW